MTLKEHLRDLIGYFAPREKPSNAVCAVWLSEMQKYDIEAIQKMSDHMKAHEETGRWPSVNRFVGYADTFQCKINQARDEQIKREQAVAAKKLYSGDLGNDEFSKICSNLLADMLNGKITRRQYIEGLEAVGINMSPLKKYLSWHDLNLDRLAGAELMRGTYSTNYEI